MAFEPLRMVIGLLRDAALADAATVTTFRPQAEARAHNGLRFVVSIGLSYTGSRLKRTAPCRRHSVSTVSTLEGSMVELPKGGNTSVVGPLIRSTLQTRVAPGDIEICALLVDPPPRAAQGPLRRGLRLLQPRTIPVRQHTSPLPGRRRDQPRASPDRSGRDRHRRRPRRPRHRLGLRPRRRRWHDPSASSTTPADLHRPHDRAVRDHRRGLPPQRRMEGTRAYLRAFPISPVSSPSLASPPTNHPRQRRPTLQLPTQQPPIRCHEQRRLMRCRSRYARSSIASGPELPSAKLSGTAPASLSFPLCPTRPDGPHRPSPGS